MPKIYAEIELRDPSRLTPYPLNTKIHPQDQIDRLAGQIAAHGFDQPIVVDRDGVIIKGHGRRAAAMQLGLEQVPVVVSEVNEHQARAARIADNQLVSLEYDTKNLEVEISQLKEANISLDLTGLAPGQIDRILAGHNFEMPSDLEGSEEKLHTGQEGETDGDQRLEYIKVGPKKIPATPQEVEAILDTCRAHEDDNGTSFGFWSSLVR